MSAECDIHGVDLHGDTFSGLVCPMCEVDERARKADEFLGRADRALVGTAGVEGADDDAIDQARSLILAARSTITRKAR